MISETLLDGVLTLRFDRPEKKNALTIDMRRTLEQLGDRCNGDSNVRCVVIASAGDTFSAGADLKEISAVIGEVPSTHPTRGIVAVECPVIAAVRGACVTGGLEIALATNIIVATPDARFADTHAKLGVIPRWGMSKLLPEKIGPTRAMEMSLSGRWVHALEAERIGLVDRVLPAETFDEDVAELAAVIASRPSALTQAIGSLMANNVGRPMSEALEAEASVGAQFTLGES